MRSGSILGSGGRASTQQRKTTALGPITDFLEGLERRRVETETGACTEELTSFESFGLERRVHRRERAARACV